MQLKCFIIILCCFGATFLHAQDNEKLFENATESYNTGNYQAAIDEYQKIIKSGSESSALYYNLANAYYKMSKVPESIYYYEKALLLNPENADARNNLIFAQQMTIDAITPMPQTWFKRISDSITSLFTLKTWAIFPIVGVFVFIIFFLLYYFLSETFFKRLFFVGMLFTMVLTVGSYFIADFHKSNIENQHFAILFDKNVRVFAEPNAYSAESFSLHEGTKVEVTETLNEWVKIRLADGKIGWIKASALKLL